MKPILSLVFLFLSFSIHSQNFTYPFLDPSIPVDARVEDLISKLSLEEKASLMLYSSPAIERLGIQEYNWWSECLHGVGRAGEATVFPQAFVQGLQGDHPEYIKVAACAKHYIVHSGPEASRHYFNAIPDEIDFRETYLPAFRELVEADVEAVMCAYNRTYDEPCCGSPFLLQDILRDEYGFDGHIVSDCWALDDIWARHKVVETRPQAA